MAVRRNKRSGRGRRRLPQAVKGGAHRLRKEPQAAAATHAGEENHHAGALRLDPQGLQLPEALAEAGETGSKDVMPGRIMLVITILAAIFIAIIAWFVSRMPRK